MNKGLGFNQPIFYDGIVEDRMDPIEAGRVRVRVFGIHSDSVSDIPTDKLPWATVMMSANNASMSGIGWSPNGIVEGTMVRVYFADGTDFQKPVVVGTVPGINISTSIESASDSSVVTPASTSQEPTRTGAATSLDNNGTSALGTTSEPYETVSTESSGIIKTTSQGKVYGSWGFSLNDGELADYVRNHSIYSDNFSGMTIGSPEFDDAWKKLASEEFKADQKLYVQNTYYNVLLRKCASLGITDRGQGVQDAIWSCAVQYGPNTTVIHEALSGKKISALTDADICVLIQMHRKNIVRVVYKNTPEQWNELEARTDVEKDGLLALCEDSPTTQSQSIERPSKDVYGQNVYKSVDTSASTSTKGLIAFRDPSGKYPTKGYKGAVDTNKLARNYKTNTTIVKVKKNSLVKGNGFEEPVTKYDAKYPFNKVFESESGHIMEFDDTDGAERIHVYHRAGTFIEFHPDGTIVRKSVKDDVEVVLANKSCYIVGNCNVVIEGDSNLKVMGNMTAQVRENIDFKAGGNITFACNGEMTLSSASIARLQGGSTVSIDAPIIAQNTGSAAAVTIDIGEKIKAELALADEDVPAGSEDDSTAPIITDPNIYYFPSKDDAASTTRKDIDEATAEIDVSQLEDKFSKHFTLQDLTTNVAITSSRHPVVSQCGLTKEQITANLQTLARYCLDPIADKFGKNAITITNAFRLANGSTSHHLSGCAADLQFAGFPVNEIPNIAEQIRQMLPSFTQIILEYHGINPIIHIGFAPNKDASPFSRVSGDVKMCFTTYDTRFSQFRTSDGKGGFFDRNRNLIHEV